MVEQQYPNLELIPSDGGSTDGSLDIVEKFRSSFFHIISAPDTGQANAVNKGFAVATGEVMGWNNSDDVLLPGGLALVGSLFALNPGVEWLTGCVTCIDEGDQVLSIRRPRLVTRTRFLAADYQWIQQESTFWRRSLWDAAGGGLDESLRLAVDGELWLRFLRHAEMMSVINRERQAAVEPNDVARAVLDAPLILRTREEAEATFPGLRSCEPKPFKRRHLLRHALRRRLHNI